MRNQTVDLGVETMFNVRLRNEITTELRDAYKMVLEDMMNSECGLLVGKYDARNGGKQFMFGVSTVMEWIACRVSDDTLDEFENLFLKNMLESERKAMLREAK